MRFLVDRCVGRRLAAWLVAQDHDVVESRTLGPDPGDEELLQVGARERRILVTIDKDFGRLVFVHRNPHSGIVRLPDAPSAVRIELMDQVLRRHPNEVADGAVVTVGRSRIRVSRSE